MNIRNYICKTFLLIVFVISFSAHASMHEFETTHLKSMGGAGVGSILVEESAFLNPAPLAFFQNASVYAQKDDSTFTEGAAGNNTTPKSTAFVLADGNPNLAGSISFSKQEEANTERKRWGLSLSSLVSERSALGINVRSSDDKNKLTSVSQKYYQTVLGISHAVDEKSSMGITLFDPFKSVAHETKLLFGVQVLTFNYITLNADFGGNYNAIDVSKALIYKGSMQVRVLDDFYVRFGGFSDKIKNESGNGYGLAWVQPRLSFEFAYKNTKSAADAALGTNEYRTKETSLSASIRF
jgi:hypothetical protein